MSPSRLVRTRLEGCRLPPAALRFGDLVALADLDARTTRFFSPGSMAVGLVSHGPNPAPGHGVGVTILLSGPASRLRGEVGRGAGLGLPLRAGAAALFTSSVAACADASRPSGGPR